MNLYKNWNHIIFEGSNNSGKDSVISEITDIYSKYRVIHHGPPKGKTKEEQIQQEKLIIASEAKVLCSDSYTIHNRAAWTGTFLFGPKYRNYDSDDLCIFRNFVKEQTKELKNTIFVILKRSLKDLQKHYDGDYIKFEDIADDKKYYEDILPLTLEELKIPYLIHNIEGTAEKNSKEIIKKLNY